jgi:hypothetical protein
MNNEWNASDFTGGNSSEIKLMYRKRDDHDRY